VPTYLVDASRSFDPPPAKSAAHLTVLSATLSGDALAELLGASPDERWDRGTKPQARGRYAGVSLGSRLAETAPPDAHLADLLERLGPAALNVRSLLADDRVHSVRLWVYHSLPNWNPGLSIPADLLERISALGTGLDIDVYVTHPAAPVALNAPFTGEIRPRDTGRH